MTELRTLARLQSDPAERAQSTLAQNTTPLPPISSKPKPYLPSYAKQHSISPFYMPDDHPQKYYMAGYTGFVPKARKYFGRGYPNITRQALQEHSSEDKRMEQSQLEPVRVFRPQEQTKSSIGIYPRDTGLVPHYTGHIPGQSSVSYPCHEAIHVILQLGCSLSLSLIYRKDGNNFLCLSPYCYTV